MNTYIFLYPETSFFEVTLVAYFMKTKGNVYIVAEEEHQTICTNEGVRIQKDISLAQRNPENVDAFRNKPLLLETINRCIGEKKIVGGICAGRTLIADAAGGLEFSETTCVLENIVLSPGNEYVDFALEVGKAAHIFADEADYQETVDYFKYFKYIGN